MKFLKNKDPIFIYIVAGRTLTFSPNFWKVYEQEGELGFTSYIFTPQGKFYILPNYPSHFGWEIIEL